MKVSELITQLQTFNQDADVAVFTTHDEGDDVMDWDIVSVHDGWSKNVEHDYVAIEIDLDQHPQYNKGMNFQEMQDEQAVRSILQEFYETYNDEKDYPRNEENADLWKQLDFIKRYTNRAE